MCSKCCCTKRSFCRSFFKQLFDIGDSAGSLLNEGINLFITFQRISAPKQFSTMFSKDCISLFKWVTNLIKIISSQFETSKPVSDFELYYLYSIVFPLTILAFITVKIAKEGILFQLILYPIFFGIGAIAGIIGQDNQNIIFIFIPVLVFILLFFLMPYVLSLKDKISRKKVQNKENNIIDNTEDNLYDYHECRFHFSFSFILTTLVFVLAALKISQRIFYLILLILIITAIVLSIVFIIEFFNLICCNNSFNSNFKYEAKMILFCNNILSLLIVPSTEKIVAIAKTDEYYRFQWCTYFSYFVINLLIPVIWSFLLIKNQYPPAIDKYRSSKKNCLHYISLIDLIKQIIYALFSAFDFVWGCLSIEILWFLMMIILHPFYRISDYSITFFTSIIIIIANSMTLYNESSTIGPLSLAETIIFFIFVCFPAIFSLYIYFIFDFNIDDIKIDNSTDDIKSDNSSDQSTTEDEKYDFITQMHLLFNIFGAFAFFLFGANVHLDCNE